MSGTSNYDRRSTALADYGPPVDFVCPAGGGSLAQNREEVRWAHKYGADAVAVLPPIYPAGLPAAGIIEYFQALEAEAKVPFILYNFPKHTGNPLTPEILKAVPHAALKDSARNLELVKSTPRYFAGTSAHILECIEHGATGYVAATANVRPALYADMETAVAAGDLAHAHILQDEMRHYSAPFSAGGVLLLKKTLAEKLADYPAYVRLPLTG